MARQARDGRRAALRGMLLWTVLVLAAGLAGTPVRAAPTDLDGSLREAEALLAAGKAAAAWALLSPLELEAAGSPDFDYLYGIAALDTGRQAAAIDALERVLAREPDFAGARMELARARYDAGDYPAARAQFDYLLTQLPPPATRAVIDRYLRAMEEGPGREGVGRSRLVPYAEIGAGWDSNANASTSDADYGGIILNSNNVETSSTFVELAGGFQHAVATGDGTGPGGAVISSGRASYRFNPDADFVDAALVSLGTAGQKSWGASRASVGVSGYYGWLDGSQHELGAGVDLGWSRRLGAHWEIGSSGRAGLVRYQQDALEILDVNRFLGSLALTRSGIGAANARVGLVTLFGTDDARDAASPYGNQRLGARLFAGWQLGSRSSLYVDAGYLETDFDDSPGFFGADRKDDQWTVSLSTEYPDWPARGYSLVPTLRFTDTASTVSLYDYDRFELGVYLRRSKR